MSHVPFFWKEKHFIGWRQFLFNFFQNKTTPWTSAEILEHIAPGNVAVQEKLQGSLSGALSTLKSSGVIHEFKVLPRRRHYILKSLLKDEETRRQVVADLQSKVGIKGGSVFESIPIEEAVPVKAHPIEKDDTAIFLAPRSEYYTKRIESLINVVFKSFDQQKAVPLEWVEEYNELIKLTKK